MKSPLCWPGGKRNLVKTILPLFPEHKIYAEPFCGSAKLLFAKEPSRFEVISDANGELINFYLVLKYRPSDLAEKMHRAIAHPHWFKAMRARAADPSSDEVDRAFQFAYLNSLSFGGQGETFGYALKEPRPKKNLRLMAAELDKLADRLSRVLIEKADFGDVIAKYDSPGTFFYCDPPYVNFAKNGRYDALDFRRLDELFDLLRSIKGKFLMSEEEDHPEVAKRVRSGKWVTPVTSRIVETTYTMAAHNTQKKAELLIANFPI